MAKKIRFTVVNTDTEPYTGPIIEDIVFEQTVENDDWMKRLPGYRNELALFDAALAHHQRENAS